MGMSAAAAKTHSHIMGGGTVVPGGGGGGMTPPTAGSHPAVATHRSPITDFFGKMMSFSSCHQTPVLPSYYQNSMYSTDKIDSHLWFGSFVLKNLLYLDLGPLQQNKYLYLFVEGVLKKMFSKYPAKNLITFKNYDVVFSQKKYLVCFFFLARNLSKSDEFGYLLTRYLGF